MGEIPGPWNRRQGACGTGARSLAEQTSRMPWAALAPDAGLRGRPQAVRCGMSTCGSQDGVRHRPLQGWRQDKSAGRWRLRGVGPTTAKTPMPPRLRESRNRPLSGGQGGGAHGAGMWCAPPLRPPGPLNRSEPFTCSRVRRLRPPSKPGHLGTEFNPEARGHRPQPRS